MVFMLTSCEQTKKIDPPKADPDIQELVAPQNVEINGHVLTFDEVDNAIYYTVRIDSLEVQIEGTSLSLDMVELNRVYTVQVKSNNHESSSPYSSGIEFEYYERVDRDQEAVYNINSDFMFHQFLLRSIEEIDTVGSVQVDKVLMDGEELDTDLYFAYYVDINIEQSFFTNLQDDVILTLYTNLGIFDLTITLEDELKPYLRSNPIWTRSVCDQYVIPYEFELCGGSLESLSGYGIQSDDYSMQDNYLLIELQFIDEVFAEYPDLDVIILGYYLQHDDLITVGYLFIERG